MTGRPFRLNEGNSTGSSLPSLRRAFATVSRPMTVLSSQYTTSSEWRSHPNATTPTSGTASAITSPDAAVFGPPHLRRTSATCAPTFIKPSGAKGDR